MPAFEGKVVPVVMIDDDEPVSKSAQSLLFGFSLFTICINMSDRSEKPVAVEVDAVGKGEYTVHHGTIEEAVLVPASTSSSVEEAPQEHKEMSGETSLSESGIEKDDEVASPKGSKKTSGLQAFVDRARGRSSPNKAKADKATRHSRKMDRAKTVHGDEAYA